MTFDEWAASEEGQVNPYDDFDPTAKTGNWFKATIRREQRRAFEAGRGKANAWAHIDQHGEMDCVVPCTIEPHPMSDGRWVRVRVEVVDAT